MTLDTIFETNPALLEAPEVQKLIDYVKEQHHRSYKINQKLDNLNHQILHICMHSEVMLIDGKPSRQTVEQILELYND